MARILYLNQNALIALGRGAWDKLAYPREHEALAIVVRAVESGGRIVPLSFTNLYETWQINDPIGRCLGPVDAGFAPDPLQRPGRRFQRSRRLAIRLRSHHSALGMRGAAVQSAAMTTAAGAHVHREFFVPGSPVSVNRYGTAAYKNWRGDVHFESVKGGTWSGCLVSTPCSVWIRYFQHLDARKDVDNILKAILDGLDGKARTGPKMAMRVIYDDRDVERVVSQRTKLEFTTKISSRRLTVQEYAAAVAALSDQASVFVSVGAAPNHTASVLR